MVTRANSSAKDSKTPARFLDSRAFAQKKYRSGWLIQGILVAGQPGVIGGPKKCLKTSLALDMAVSLGTGKPFLGRFKVPEPRRVAVMSGESGEATLQDTARRICASKGISLDQCDVFWSFKLPRLASKQDRMDLRKALSAAKVAMVIIDPLYLCLLDGSLNKSASNLYDVGPLLRATTQACLKAGATPIFIHHATKTGGKRAVSAVEPLELDDLMFSGVGEFVRQWALVSRAAAYQPGTGHHELLFNAGGSTGHSACHRIVIDEGTCRSSFGGRQWTVDVEPVDTTMERHNGQRRKDNIPF